MASLTSNNKTLEELILTLFEDMRLSRITKADRDKTLLDILKKHKENIEQNQKKINEQQELIEHLWAWAEERDEEKYKGMTPSEADAAAYMDIMYPVEEEEKYTVHCDSWGCSNTESFKDFDDAFGNSYTPGFWTTHEGSHICSDCLPCHFPNGHPEHEEPCNNYTFDYRNFKLYDEYCGEKKGYKFLPKGPHGSGYYKVIDK